MKKTVLVFDLDDTLYDELQFVYSGFRAVAAFIEKEKGLARKKLYAQLLTTLQRDGRGKIFNTVLAEHGINSQTFIRRCLGVYRLHKPDIKLNPEAIDCLKRFRYYPKYLVTDGNKIVQGNKVAALKLEKFMNGIYITHRFGLNHAKPSPYCFFKIAQQEKVMPAQVVYVADNISKDFVGIKKEGFKTIRVQTGQYQHVHLPARFHAHGNISSLEKLTPETIEML